MAKVLQIADPDSIAYLVCHHPDPDIAAGLRDLSTMLTREDVRVVTEWRAEALLKHYGHRFGYVRVEEQDGRLPLGARAGSGVPVDPVPALPGRDGVLRHRNRDAVLLRPVRRVRPGLGCAEVAMTWTTSSRTPGRSISTTCRPPSCSAPGWPGSSIGGPRSSGSRRSTGTSSRSILVAGAFAALADIDCGVFTLAHADVGIAAAAAHLPGQEPDHRGCDGG